MGQDQIFSKPPFFLEVVIFGLEVLGGSPRLTAMAEATGSQGERGGPQATREARPEKKQRSQADVVIELYCFV